MQTNAHGARSVWTAGLGGTLAPGVLCSVPFALGTATVRLLDRPYQYHDGEVWHVEDVATGHQDFVGTEWLTPNV